MLKVDLHCHTNLDPKDGLGARDIVKHSPEELFAEAKKQNFDAIALTHHLKLIDTQKIRAAAQKYGITYIPGVEVEIQGIHVLLLNPPHDEVKTFEELEILKYKHPEMLVVAPHPYFPGKICLGDNLTKYIKLFDAIEYSHFYTNSTNWFNQKAQDTANIHSKPVVGNSDVHYLDFFGTTFTHVHTDNNSVDGILSSIKQGRCSCVTMPLRKRDVVKASLPFMKRIPRMIRGG